MHALNTYAALCYLEDRKEDKEEAAECVNANNISEEEKIVGNRR